MSPCTVHKRTSMKREKNRALCVHIADATGSNVLNTSLFAVRVLAREIADVRVVEVLLHSTHSSGEGSCGRTIAVYMYGCSTRCWRVSLSLWERRGCHCTFLSHGRRRAGPNVHQAQQIPPVYSTSRNSCHSY